MLLPALLLTLLSAPDPVAAVQDEDLGTRAAAVLEKRCARCHQEESPQPKAKRYWPDARDLAATVAHETLVTAGDPEGSDLWFAIVEDETMPPEGEPEFPMPAEERALIEEWIAAGAPLPPQETAQDPAVGAETETETDPEVGSESAGAETFTVPAEPESGEEVDSGSPFGKLHPLVVHFPIALLTVAMLSELLSLLRLGKLQTTTRFCLWLGLLGGFVAAFLGWSLGDLQPRSGSSAALLETHRWYGVATLGVNFLALVAAELRARREGFGLSSLLAPLFILAGGAVVGWTGHMGGALSYGPDWLDDAMPGPVHDAFEYLEETLPRVEAE